MNTNKKNTKIHKLAHVPSGITNDRSTTCIIINLEDAAELGFKILVRKSLEHIKA